VKKLSFKSSEQKIWFVSDLHVGHNKPFILNPRFYNNVNEAVQHTFDMMYSHIGPDDILFNLGDMVCGAGANSEEYAKRVITIPCKQHYYIWGNHSAGIKGLYDKVRNDIGLLADDIDMYPLPYPNSPFIFLGHYAEVFIDSTPVVLTHYPIASWNHMGDGGYNIHGHCHRNLKEDGTIKRLDVGWDWKKRPVEWNEIVRELKSNKFSPVDHHGADTSSFFE
jgi:calcineurin-like phosphoesterase family protein